MIEAENGHASGWPVLRRMIQRAIDDTDINPDAAFIIPTLDGVDSDVSFLSILCGDDCRNAPIIICSAKTIKSKLRAARNLWFFSRDGNAEFVEKVENMVRQRHALSESIKAGIRAAAERGIAMGAQRPGSHRFTPSERSKGGKATASKRRNGANKPYQKWIAEMCGWRKSGKSLDWITRKLATMGAKKPDGSKIALMQVSRILNREIHSGKLRLG